MRACSVSAYDNTEFSIATAIYVSTMFISLQKRPPFSIASSLTTGFASSISQTISLFWRWISISKIAATLEIEIHRQKSEIVCDIDEAKPVVKLDAIENGGRFWS